MEENMKNGDITVETGRPPNEQGEEKGFSWESDDEGSSALSGRDANGIGGYSDGDDDGNGEVDGDGEEGEDECDGEGEGGWDEDEDGDGEGNCPFVSGSPVTIRVEPEIMSADGEEFIWDPEEDVSPPHQSAITTTPNNNNNNTTTTNTTTTTTSTTTAGSGMSYGCGCCGQQFIHLRQLMEHMAQHAPQVGGVSQTTTTTQQIFTVTPSIQPPVLPMIPVSRPLLPQPAPSIIPPPNFGFACVLCGKVFARQGHLAMHCRLGHGVSPTKGWGLKVAPSTFIQQVRAKDVERPFECQLCQKRFVRKHHLQAHLRSHSGIKPFNCPLCGKALSSKQSVGIHMRQHEPIPQMSAARPQ